MESGALSRACCARAAGDRKRERPAHSIVRAAGKTSGGAHTPSQGVVTGKPAAIAVASELHCGWPQPLTLTPSCWPGCGVMS